MRKARLPAARFPAIVAAMAVGSIDRLLAAMTVEVDAFALCGIAPDAVLVVRPLNLIEVHFLLDGTLHLAAGNAAPIRVDPGGIMPASDFDRAGSRGGRDQRRICQPQPFQPLGPLGLRRRSDQLSPKGT